jgi:hypothetical protein
MGQPLIASPEPEKKEEPEPLPEPEPMILSQVVVKQTSINEEELDQGQKSIFRHMQENPFQDTVQAPDVDKQMLISLGSASTKANQGENRWVVEYENGTKYTGDIVTDEASNDYEQPVNFGKFEFPNGDKYEGTVGVRAKGTYTHSNGVVYEGQFFKLRKSGMGKQTFPEGHAYEGMFKDNLYNGKGVMTFSNGDFYKGTFKDGKRNHIGTYNFVEEKVTGDWSDDLLHGNGQYNFKNGQKVKSAFQASAIKL